MRKIAFTVKSQKMSDNIKHPFFILVERIKILNLVKEKNYVLNS